MVRKKPLLEEASSSSRSRTAVKKLKDIKDSSISSPTTDVFLRRSKNSSGKGKGKNNTAASTSPVANESPLRRSLRESPLKKSSESCSSARKSARLENQNVPSPLKKRNSEREVKKESGSPLRRSVRIEKFSASSSSDSKRSSKSSGSSKDKKKVNVVNNGKDTSALVTSGEQKSKKPDRSTTPLLKKRKRLDARTYRSLLAKKSKITDSSEAPYDFDSRADDSAAVSDGGDKCCARKCDDQNESEELCLEGPKESAEGSSSDSRELGELPLVVDGDASSACFKMKQKVIESSQSKYAENVANLQFSLVGRTAKDNFLSTAERETDADVDTSIVCKTDMEDLGTLKPEEFSSQDRSIAHDILQESGAISPGLTNPNKSRGIGCNKSVPSNDKSIETQATPTTDTCFFPPSTRMENLEQCTNCSKHSRVQDMQAKDLCICIERKANHLSASSFEEVHEKFSSDKHAANLVEEDAAKGDLVSESKSQTDIAEKPSCSVASACTTNVNVLMEETRARQEFSCMDIAKGHTSSTLSKEPLFEIQTDCAPPKACIVCKKPETELSCGGKGCNACYHLSCLDPPLQNAPPGVWMCIICTKRKIEFGVYSVSEGIDSVWDVKEGQNGKHYRVKYKGLAHVHNQWISETQMLQEAPALLSKFNRKYQKKKVSRWKKEWAEPHRLLQKRSLMSQKLADEFFDGLGDKITKCYCEWFVKWKGLGYEDATWELESSPFLCTPMAMTLMKDYEIRADAKASFASSNADKALEFKTNSFHKLTRLPDGHPTGLDNDHLDSINRLREFWHRNQNALFIDAQERVIKSILFMLSILSYACRPFLIISLSASLSTWETQLNFLAPSINFVIYSGSKDVRRMIRNLEFYEKGGRIMFQVLLSHPDAVIEDLEALECISWEALFIDECQNFRISKHLELLKLLSSGFRLLLLGGQLKDSAAEYLNLLSFLDSGLDRNSICTVDSPTNDPVGTLALLKERLLRYTAYERKPDSKLLEYWVPVHLSNVQLEQYCATLISKSIPLRSCSKTDLVGALPDTVILTKKCCDHPYLVDDDLQTSLMKDFPTKYVDIGINASGKLHVLDKILQMVQNQGLRVLVFFQSIGRPGGISLGDILDDVIRQRFGANSYERIDRGLAMKKKQSATNSFNDRAGGRFIFLIESHACQQSIKLSSVDAVIIYNSDWNPLNDIRSLQKITIESQCDRVAVFRLYSSFTVEEKSLICAKEDMILYNNIENLSPSVCHSLLSWGASYLFHQLDEFHQLHDSDICTQGSADKTIDDVLEILTKLPTCSSINCSVAVKAPQSGASYSRNIILTGEKEGASSLDKDPCSFWSYLLDGRYPQWKHITEPSCSQRSRRKVHNLCESAIHSEPEYEEVKKRQKKIVTSSSVDINSSESWVQGRIEAEDKNTKIASIPNSLPMETDLQSTSHENVLSHVSPISDATSDDNPHEIDLEGRDKLRTAQRSLHILLKPELAKLCEILEFPENVKDMAQVFLEYIMNNHHVSPEPEMILQAFKISLCWRAASFLKHNIDHKESLALAEKYLKFTCNEQQVSNVYKKLKILKKFLHQNSGLRSKYKQNSSASNLNRIGKVGLKENPQSQIVLEQLKLPEHEQVPVPVTPADLHGDLGSSKDEPIEERIHLINKIFLKREEEILLKQQKEMSDFNMHKEKLELSMKKSHDRILELINDLVLDPADKNNKIRLFKEEFLKKMVLFGNNMDDQCQKLKGMQSVARDKEQQLKIRWLEEVKAGKLPNSIDSIPLSDSGFILEEFKIVDLDNADDGLRERILISSEANDITINATTVATEKQGVADNTKISCLGSIPSENIEQGRHADNVEGRCLTTSLTQNQADSPSLVRTITSIGCENGVLPSQEPYLRGNERPGNSADLENQGGGIPQEIPASDVACYGTSQVELTDNCNTVSDSLNNSLPIWRESPATENQESIAVSGIEEPSTQIQPSSQPNVMPMQETAVSPFSLVGQSNLNGLVSQFVDHSVLPNSEIRFHGNSDDLTSTSTQPESVRYPLFPLTQLMPTQGLQSEPLKNELARIRMHEDRMAKMHDDRKLQLKFKCEQELEKIRKKYDMLLQDAESEFIQNKEFLETIYNKVFMNQILAEEFRAKFIDNPGGASSTSQGPRALQQLLQSSQPQFVQRSASPATSIPTPLPAALPSATAPNLLASVRPRAPPISSGPTVRPSSSVFPSTLVRPHFSSMLPPRANLQVGSEARAPAPHLHRFRANSSITSQSLRAHTSRAATLQHTPNAGSATLQHTPNAGSATLQHTPNAGSATLQHTPNAGSVTLQHTPTAGSATLRQVAGIANTRPCMVPLSGTGQPVFSNTTSVCRNVSQTNAELLPNVGDSRSGANQPNMPQLADLAPSFDRWLASNRMVASSGLPQSGVDVAGPSSNPNSDVVCISDDE